VVIPRRAGSAGHGERRSRTEIDALTALADAIQTGKSG
jgi:hypothetical protein